MPEPVPAPVEDGYGTDWRFFAGGGQWLGILRLCQADLTKEKQRDLAWGARYWLHLNREHQRGIGHTSGPQFNVALLKNAFTWLASEQINWQDRRSISNIVDDYVREIREDREDTLASRFPGSIPVVHHEMKIGSNVYMLQGLEDVRAFEAEGAMLEHCMKDENDEAQYFDDSLPGEDGWSKGEYFSIRKKWNSATTKERERAINRLFAHDQNMARDTLVTVLQHAGVPASLQETDFQRLKQSAAPRARSDSRSRRMCCTNTATTVRSRGTPISSFPATSDAGTVRT